MSTLDPHLQDIYDVVLRRNPGEDEFHQAVFEVFESLVDLRDALDRTPLGRPD